MAPGIPSSCARRAWRDQLPQYPEYEDLRARTADSRSDRRGRCPGEGGAPRYRQDYLVNPEGGADRVC